MLRGSSPRTRCRQVDPRQRIDGTVTLNGRIDLPYQRDEAEEIARQVPGVSALRDHLSISIAVSPNQVLERMIEAIGEEARITSR